MRRSKFSVKIATNLLSTTLKQEPTESVKQGAASSFMDNACSWQELHAKVQQRQQELQWEMPDLENVCRYCL